MPRKARIDAPGALQHIIVRGIERRKVFIDDEDRDALERRHALKAKGMCVGEVAERVAQIRRMPGDRIRGPGSRQSLAAARSLLCFWAVRELGERMAAMGRRLGISTVAVSTSVRRGAEIAKGLDVKSIR